MTTEKLKRHKSPGVDQIPAEWIEAIRSEIHKLINSIWNKEELPEEWMESIIVLMYKKGDKTDVVFIGALHFCQVRTKFNGSSCCQS